MNKSNKIIHLLKDNQKKKAYKHTMIYSSGIELLIDKVCEKTEIGRIQVKQILDSQFKMLRAVMNKEGLITSTSKLDDFESIRIMRLGSFMPSKKKFEMIQKYVIEKEKEDLKK